MLVGDFQITAKPYVELMDQQAECGYRILQIYIREQCWMWNFEKQVESAIETLISKRVFVCFGGFESALGSNNKSKFRSFVQTSVFRE